MKKTLSLIITVLILCLLCFGQNSSMTNEDVKALVTAGIDETVIVTKIRNGNGTFDTSTQGLINLKNAGVSSEIIKAMIEHKNQADNPRKRITDGLSAFFPTLKNGVVTVWSETGHGSGFIVDKRGLIVTNYHVIGPSKFMSIQFDRLRKVEARLIASDPEADVAILLADISPFENAIAVKLADIENPPTVIEGERVLALGSPLNQRKIMTTGIVSKIEKRAILSDVNINPGNSGGPLFNSLGEVVGINTFGDFANAGPGISGIIKLEQAMPTLKKALTVLEKGEMEKPSARLLPVEPAGDYPLEAIRDVAFAKKFDDDPYEAEAGKFQVRIITPKYKYRLATENEREALKGRKDRTGDDTKIEGTFNPFQNLYGWREYLGDYKPVLQIQVIPEIKETTGSLFGRAILGGLTGVQMQANLKFKEDFYKMKLFCGEREIEPIHPAKAAILSNRSDRFVKLKDASYVGIYTYPPNAINSECGGVRIEVFSEKKPDKAQNKRLSEKDINQIAGDFLPYYESVKP